MSLDEKTASAVTILQQIIDMSNQGAFNQQQTENGPVLNINPDTIIVQQEGEELLVADGDRNLENGQYVIQYVTQPEEQVEELSMVEVQTDVVETEALEGLQTEVQSELETEIKTEEENLDWRIQMEEKSFNWRIQTAEEIETEEYRLKREIETEEYRLKREIETEECRLKREIEIEEYRLKREIETEEYRLKRADGSGSWGKISKIVLEMKYR